MFRVAAAGVAGAAPAFELGGCARAPWRHARGKAAAAAAGAGSQCMTARGLYRYRISAHGPLAREREREKERQITVPGGRARLRDVITTRADRSSCVVPFPRAPTSRGYESSRGSATGSTDAQCVTKVCDGIAEIHDARRIRRGYIREREREDGREGEGGRGARGRECARTSHIPVSNVDFVSAREVHERRRRRRRRLTFRRRRLSRELFAKSAARTLAKGASRSMNDYANYCSLHSASTRQTAERARRLSRCMYFVYTLSLSGRLEVFGKGRLWEKFVLSDR